jgi:hypothetical protein
MHRALASALMLDNPIKLIIQIAQVTLELILMIRPSLLPSPRHYSSG